MVHMMDINNDDEFDNIDDTDFGDIDDNAFEDFDETQKGSLKDVWQNNPLLKLGVIGVGLFVVVLAIFLFGGSSEKNDSAMAPGKGYKELAGQEDLNPDMTQRIDETNDENYRINEATGGSAVPIPTTGFKTPEEIEQEQEALRVEDPLATWRGRNQQEQEIKETEPQLVETQPVTIPTPQPVLQPNPEMVAALGNGFGAQMRQILESQTIKTPNFMIVTEKGYLAQRARELAEERETIRKASGLDDSSAELPDAPEDILVPAGEVYYAQTLTEANTDAPGPVLAQILQGPLKGSRILGGFSENEEYLTITFDKVVFKDRTVDVDAIALDADTTLPGVVTDIDRRYFKRVILPAAAAFVEGFGSAVAETGNTSVAVAGETVTTSEEDLNTREELLKGVEEGTSVIASFLQDEASNTRVMIKVAAGTPIGILFLEEITEADAAGRSNQ